MVPLSITSVFKFICVCLHHVQRHQGTHTTSPSQSLLSVDVDTDTLIQSCVCLSHDPPSCIPLPLYRCCSICCWPTRRWGRRWCPTTGRSCPPSTSSRTRTRTAETVRRTHVHNDNDEMRHHLLFQRLLAGSLCVLVWLLIASMQPPHAFASSCCSE